MKPFKRFERCAVASCKICAISEAGQQEPFADANKASSGATEIRDRWLKRGRTSVCVHICDDVSLLTPRTCNGCSSNLLCVRSSSAWLGPGFFLPSGWTVACVWRRCLACRAAGKMDEEKMNGKKRIIHRKGRERRKHLQNNVKVMKNGRWRNMQRNESEEKTKQNGKIDSINSAKFWIKKWGKKVNKLKKGTENTKQFKKGNTGERKRKKTKMTKKHVWFESLFWCGIRFVELEPIFFGKKGVAKKWKKKTKWKLKQRNEIENVSCDGLSCTKSIIPCLGMFFGPLSVQRFQNKMFCIGFRCRLAIAIVLWRFPADQCKKHVFCHFSFFFLVRAKARTPENPKNWM